MIANAVKLRRFPSGYTPKSRGMLHTPYARQARQYSHQTPTPLKRDATHYFASTNLMLEALLPLSPEERAQLRHIHVKGFPVPLYSLHDSTCYNTYPFATALDMLPGLQLDSLHVEDVYHDEGDGFGHSGTYWEVEDLLDTDGWRQLLFYSPTSEMLGWPSFGSQSQRKAQPGGWQRQIINRGSNVSVSLFKGRSPDTVFVSRFQQTNALEMISLQEWEPFAQQEPWEDVALGNDTFLMDAATTRPILVFAENNGPYQQTGEKLPTNVRQIVDEFKGDWSRIREHSSLYVDPELDPTAHL
ncbi:hypothetical protein HWV62_12094 [Athelia sp. TMB]|nr:hypothetical protein HWV62_12094 [Athelia sp. TMB]